MKRIIAPSSGAMPRATLNSVQLDPDYGIAQLRAHKEHAVTFARLCQELFPELSDEVDLLIERDEELFREVRRRLLRRSPW